MGFRIGLVLMAASAIQAQVAQIGRGVNLYSPAKEAALGVALAEDIRRTSTPLDSAVVRDYVEAIGARLAAQLPQQPSVRFTFEVVAGGDSPVEPISLPGGPIFVQTGLILSSGNEAEFAGALAHAIAHVAARHATRTASRAEIAQQTAAALPDGNFPGVGFLQFPRGFELEADVIAVNIAAAAGFDPNGLASYISRVQNDATDRVFRIQRAIAALPQRSYASSTEFARIQEEVRRLSAPK